MYSKIENAPPATVATGLVNRLTMAIRNNVSVISAQADRNLRPSKSEIQRNLEFALARPRVAKHQHGEAVHRKTPDHSEGIQVRQEGDVTAADDDGYDLQENDDVNDAVAGAVARVRLPEPVAEYAVFGNPIEHSVGAHNGGIHGAGKNQRAYDNDKSVEDQSNKERPFQVHGQSAD